MWENITRAMETKGEIKSEWKREYETILETTKTSWGMPKVKFEEIVF